MPCFFVVSSLQTYIQQKYEIPSSAVEEDALDIIDKMIAVRTHFFFVSHGMEKIYLDWGIEDDMRARNDAVNIPSTNKEKISIVDVINKMWTEYEQAKKESPLPVLRIKDPQIDSLLLSYKPWIWFASKQKQFKPVIYTRLKTILIADIITFIDCMDEKLTSKKKLSGQDCREVYDILLQGLEKDLELKEKNNSEQIERREALLK
jgi:hypothetical protein